MTLNYQLTLDDYIEVSKDDLRRDPFKLYSFLILGTLLGLVSLLALGLLIGSGKADLNVIFVSLFLLAISCNLIFPIIFLRYRVRKVMQKNPTAIEPVVADCTVERILFNGKGFSTGLEWSMFSKFKETKSCCVLYLKEAQHIIVPKRAFANDDDLNQFRAWAS